MGYFQGSHSSSNRETLVGGLVAMIDAGQVLKVSPGRWDNDNVNGKQQRAITSTDNAW